MHWIQSCVLLAAGGTPASAAFHFMQIEQVIGGVNGDLTAQAIQLRERTFLQCSVGNGAELWVRDAAGDNPVLLIDFDGNVPGCQPGDRILVASPGLADYTVEPLAADFTMTNLIPAGFLAAGTLTLENAAGSVLWRLSWGGDAYTGPTGGTLDNDADGEFGPPFDGGLPSDGSLAIQFQGAATALSTNNADDYTLSRGSALFTNNACEPLRLGDPCPLDCGCPPNGMVDIFDFIAVLIEWGRQGSPCDLDGDGIGIGEFLAVLGSWGACE